MAGTEDWSVCRLCLQSRDEPLKYMCGTLYNSLTYRNIYFAVTGVVLKNYKSFPTQICRICEENMINAYNFRQQCLETEGKLSDLESIDEKEVQKEPEKIIEETVRDDQENNPDVPDASDEPDQEVVMSLVSEEETVGEEDTRKILCKRCKLVFKGFEIFRKHRCRGKRKAPRKVQPKEPKVKKVTLGSNVLYQVANPCKICGKMIKGSHYVQHMDYHNGIKRYECEHCGEKFFWWTARRTHIYKEHLKKKVCQCPFCPKEFYITGSMKNHIRTAHPDKSSPLSRLHLCEVCGKGFKVTSQLRKHSLMHVEGGICSYCGKSYSTKLRLIKHLKIHEKREKADCPICQKTMRSVTILRSHFKKQHPNMMHLFPAHPNSQQ
ncbi:zinc finger protein 99-like [Phlebotomus argentipes]|uniref:zinc finger protein 99-like n=1 Tax=Phlebotomus argentipes TaxID=94469 RepID=UPI0028935FEF|nr:zinc finger protein 99-like [Phlebotomus argentipes]